jgi:septal ring factor EnvC (AmiA/AmiB activator)
MADENQLRDNGGSRPVPDPTVLTTEALMREISALKELIVVRIDAQAALTDERFDRISTCIETIEKQRLEQKRDVKEAVDAALASQKEAATKLEASTTKALEELSKTISAEITSVRREIKATEDRISRVEFGPPTTGGNSP